MKKVKFKQTLCLTNAQDFFALTVDESEISSQNFEVKVQLSDVIAKVHVDSCT